MNRHDRAAWKRAVSLAGLGELVVAWLNGDVRQTPGHLGPPDPETIPLTGALTLANRAGFVTDNSQAADSREGRVWEAWVTGFASDTTLARLRAAAAGTALILTACRDREHGCQWRRCPRREVLGYWLQRSPRVAGLESAWWVTITDPEPGRNDLLWPALWNLGANVSQREHGEAS